MLRRRTLIQTLWSFFPFILAGALLHDAGQLRADDVELRADDVELRAAEDDAVAPEDDAAAADDPPMASIEVSNWTAEMVRICAAQNAAGARALEAERRSVAAGYDRHKSEQRQQACLVQMVLADLAMHDRNRAAAEALSTYYRIVAVEQQLRTLRDGIEVLETMTQLADKAAEFDLPDGDANALRQQRLELAERVIDAEFGIRKLRVRLARLTCQPLELTNAAELVDPIPPAYEMMTVDGAIADALAHRADLRAITTVCRYISNDTMPAVRSLMGVVQPGMGLAMAVASKPSLLCLGGDQGQDRCARRDQCRQLASARRGQIEDEVRLAHLELQACYQRTELASERLELAKQAAAEQAKAVELEQGNPGSDLLAALKSLEVRGEWQVRLMEQSLAEVELLEARGAAWR